MRKKWNSFSNTRKAVTVVDIAARVLVVLLAVLQILDLWDEAIDIFFPLLGVVQLCRAYLEWDTDRDSAALSLLTAVIVFVCTGIIFFIF